MEQSINKRANFIRYNFIENMDNLLLAFENKINSNGLNLHWIIDEEELVSYIKTLLPKQRYNKVCFDNIPVPEEFNSKADNIVKLVDVKDFDANNDTAELLVVKANFGIVDTGSIVLFNHKSKNCLNKVDKLVLILDMNNLIPKTSDLSIILSLYDDSVDTDTIDFITKPFDKITSNSFHFNNEKSYSMQGVDISIVLYNNGVTDILADSNLRQSLYCINCGRCKNVCPVYNCYHKNSPIDTIRHFATKQGHKNYDIFQSTMLCGNCGISCPVMIPFTHLFLNMMELKSSQSHDENLRDLAKTFEKREKLNKKNGKILRYFFFKKQFRNNKMLQEYFGNQEEDFFNLNYTKPEENA